MYRAEKENACYDYSAGFEDPEDAEAQIRELAARDHVWCGVYRVVDERDAEIVSTFTVVREKRRSGRCACYRCNRPLARIEIITAPPDRWPLDQKALNDRAPAGHASARPGPGPAGTRDAGFHGPSVRRRK